MAKGAYIGVNGVARKNTKAYLGVDGVARKIKNGYIGVNGVARQHFGKYSVTFRVDTTSNRTLHDYYSGVDGDTWRFYLDSTGEIRDTGNPHRAVVDIIGSDLGGKTVIITAKRSANNIDDDGVTDAAKAVYWEIGSDTPHGPQWTSTNYATKTFTISDDVNHLRIGVWLASEGRAQIEMIVTAVEIDGEKIL